MFLLRAILLMAGWVLLSGRFDALHLGLGVVASLIVARTTEGLLFRDPGYTAARRLRHLVAFLGYFVWFFGEVVKANIHVLGLALHPRVRERLDPRLVRFRTRLEGEFARFLLATSITLTPGTVTVRIEGDEFLVHAISREAARGLPGEMEARLAAVFGGEARG